MPENAIPLAQELDADELIIGGMRGRREAHRTSMCAKKL
jgi:predicted nucleic acid-binding protein